MTNRSKIDNNEYALGIVFMLAGFFILAMWLYLIPYLFFGYQYDVPEIVMHLTHYFEMHHDVDGYLLLSAVLLPPLIIAGLLFYMARLISLDAAPEDEEPSVLGEHYSENNNTVNRRSRSGLRPLMYVTLVVSLVYGGFLLIEWLIEIF